MKDNIYMDKSKTEIKEERKISSLQDPLNINITTGIIGRFGQLDQYIASRAP